MLWRNAAAAYTCMEKFTYGEWRRTQERRGRGNSSRLMESTESPCRNWMKIGIDSYCYHRFFGEVYPDQSKPERQMTFDDFLTRSEVLGAQAVALEAAFFPTQDETYLLELKSKLEGMGLECIMSWGHPNGLERGLNQESFEQMKALIPQARKIGADVMRIVVSNYVWRNEDHAEQITRLTPVLKEAAKVAKDNEVKLAIENNIDFTGEQLLKLIEAVDEDNVGVAFDSGNFARLLDDPLHAMELLVNCTYTVRLKDVQPNPKEASLTDWYFFSCVPVGQGLTDDQAIVNILAQAGYKGVLSLQIDQPHTDWFGREDEMVALSVNRMKQLVNYAGA